MTGMFQLLKSSTSNKGFTLLEVLIAMAIMAVALGAIIAVEGGSINASVRAKQMNVVAMLAKNQMVEMEYKIRNKTFDEIKKSDEGTFPAPYQDYRWRAIVKEIKFPRISTTGGAGGKGAAPEGQADMAEMVGKLVTNFLSKAIREVSVSVMWTAGTKEQSFTIATYWVNLNHEFSLSE